MSPVSIEDAHRRLTSRLIDTKGITGTAIGLRGGSPCITVYVEKRGKALERKIPGTFEGHPVVVEETGEFRRLDA